MKKVYQSDSAESFSSSEAEVNAIKIRDSKGQIVINGVEILKYGE